MAGAVRKPWHRTPRQIRIISYNPMTIESEGRLADICQRRPTEEHQMRILLSVAEGLRRLVHWEQTNHVES